MPHKVVDKDTIKRLQDYIEGCNMSIDRIRVISRERSNEGVKYALEIIQGLKVEAQANKGRMLQKPTPMNFVKAHGFEQKEKAYEKVLDMFEDPKSAISFYQSEITRVKNQLREWDSLEKR